MDIEQKHRVYIVSNLYEDLSISTDQARAYGIFLEMLAKQCKSGDYFLFKVFLMTKTEIETSIRNLELKNAKRQAEMKEYEQSIRHVTKEYSNVIGEGRFIFRGPETIQ